MVPSTGRSRLSNPWSSRPAPNTIDRRDLVEELAFPDAIVAELVARFGSNGLPIDERTLRTGLAVAFYAGLKREEERPLAFGIAFVEPDEPKGLEGKGLWHAFVFAEPKEATTSNVAKLAAALDPEQASIGVYPRREKPDI